MIPLFFPHGNKQLLINEVSQRGVVFLRDQHVNPQQMRELCERITLLAGSVSRALPLDIPCIR